MKQPHKHAEVLRAIADGKKVQHNAFMRSSDWYGASKHCNPISHPELEWRVKPEPKPDVVNMYDLRLRIRLTFDGDTCKLKNAEVLE